MSKVYTDPTNYSNIAAAIREKNGGSAQYKPNQMADAIRAIETEPVIEPLSVTENRSYAAPEGVDGYSPVTVNVSGGGGTSRLPSAYQEVEYIAGTGTQYIDTLTPVPAGARFEFEIFNIYKTAWGGYFGTSNTSGFRLICSNSSSNAYLQYNGSSGGSFSFPMEKRDTYHLTDSALYNSVGVTYTTHPSFQTNEYSLLIWMSRFGTGLDVIGCFRLYRFLMYSSAGAVLLNLVPCYRKADNEVGLYDLVSDSFFANVGTGTFLKGRDIAAAITPLEITANGTYAAPAGIAGYTPIVVNVPGGEMRVPAAYREIEYLGSTGTQFIDTGELQIDGIDITFQYTTVSKSIFGARDAEGTNRFGLTIWDSQYHVMPPGYELAVADTGIHRLVYGAKWNWDMSLDDVLRSTSEDHSISRQRTMALFCENYVSSYSQKSSCRIYGAKLYRGNTPVRDFIPCYRIADGVCGMYDIVEDEFLTNSGTGVFLQGPSIPRRAVCRVFTNADATTVSGYYIYFSGDTLCTSADADCSYMVLDLTGYENCPIDITISGGNRQRMGFVSRFFVGADSSASRYANNTNDSYTAASPYIYSSQLGYIRKVPPGYPFLMLYTSNQVMSETIPIRVTVGNI